MTKPKEDFLKLILVSNKGLSPTRDYFRWLELCIEGGITAVQLREKSLSYEDLLSFAESLKKFLDSFHIPLIINDHLGLCLQIEASGVHLGQSDGDPVEARKALGSDKIIGLTVNTMAQLKSTHSLPLDYIGLGALFQTKNKSNVETIWGLKGLKQASLIASHPIVAIGGIHERNAASVIQSGAWGIAAIGAFHDTRDPYLTTKHLATIKVLEPVFASS